ncbi:MAG: hypothetical protein U0Z26_18570 [Anaerolineales bacterium]
MARPVRLGTLAEKYFVDDPNTSLIKMRQFGELLAKHVATKMGTYEIEKEESQYELLRRLRMKAYFHRRFISYSARYVELGRKVSHAIQGDSSNCTLMFLKN